MDAVVPAAGQGTRLRPLTEDRPKSLVEVAGRPLLAHVFDALAPADPDSYVVVIGYRGDRIHEHFGEEYRGTPIEYVRQDEQLGLAHAIVQAEPVVDGPFLVCNGDNVLARDLRALAAAHREGAVADAPPAAATLLVEETSVEEARQTGVVVTDEVGHVERVVEKPLDPRGTLVSAGAFAFSPAIFEACRAIEPSDRGEYELPDAITLLIERGHDVRAARFEGERINVNDRADLDRAAAIVENRGF